MHPETAPPAHAGVPLAEAALTFITVSYQTAEEVQRLLISLRAHPPSLPWHLVIVDNASPDGSGPLLAERHGHERDVTVRCLPENIGFGRANTLIAAELACPWVALVNPDCEISEDPFAACIEYLEAHPEVGVVGPRFYRWDWQLEASVRRFPSPAAGLGGRLSPITLLWPQNPWARHYLIRDLDSPEPRQVDWVAGTLMVLRTEEFQALAGFDPEYFLFWEDCDLCWRYWHEREQTTISLLAGRVRHVSGAAAKKARPIAIRHFNRGAYIFVRKRLYRSPLHPLRWFAWFALGLRSRVHLARTR